jgi:hypothetical protein
VDRADAGTVAGVHHPGDETGDHAATRFRP